MNYMIKCNNKNKNELLEYLKKKPSENGFFIGDIENYSLEEDFLDVWMIKNINKIETVLMRYYNYFHISTDTLENIKNISETIEQYQEAITVSGMEIIIDEINKYIKFSKIRKMYLAELKKESFIDFKINIEPEKAKINDLDELFEFEMSIEEFAIDTKSKEGYGKDLINNTGRIYFLRENEKIVAKAGVSAENSVNGMIIGVATDKNYRNKGYAKACLGKLCKEIISDNKRAVLFYDNPNAGKLYSSIGFRDINKFVSGIL